MQRQNQNSQPPYLFYSPRCSYCTQLINLIKQYKELSQMIKPVNIHTSNNIPNGVNSVPSIIFNGQLLSGTDTFKWVHFQVSLQNQGQGQGQNYDQGQMNRQMGGQQMGGQQMEQEDPKAPIPMLCTGDLCFTEIVPENRMAKTYTVSNYEELTQGSAKDGSDGIDLNAANNPDMAYKRGRNSGNDGRDSGTSLQMQQLQKLRGYEGGGNGGGRQTEQMW